VAHQVEPGRPTAAASRARQFYWVGESHLRAGDLLAAELPSDELSGQEEARAFLIDTLAAGPLPAREVLAAAKVAGISERTLLRAKAQERVEARRTGGYGDRGEWVWSVRR
jgi:hypothetical protein